MNTWNNLSLSEKSEMMRVAIENGITALPEIREAYNQFALGGFEDNKPKFQKSSEAYYDPDSDTVFAPDSTGEYYYHELFHARPDNAYLQKIAPLYSDLNDEKLTQMGADLPFVKRFEGDPGHFYSPEEVGARRAAASYMLKQAGVKSIDDTFLNEARKDELKYGNNFRDLLHMYNNENLLQLDLLGNQFAEGGDTVGEWVDAIYQNNPQEEFLGEPEHHYDFTQSEEWTNTHGYYPDARGHRDDRVKKPAHPSHPSRGAWDGDKFVLSELGMQNPNYTLFGLNDGGQDPQAVLTYQGGSVIPEITATPNGNYFFNSYDNIKLKFAKGGYIPSKVIKDRISGYEGKAMTGAKDPVTGKWGKNNSFESEAARFYNVLPENIREQVLSNPELADNLYSYSYNVGAGNFKKRVVPALERYYAGEDSIKDIENSMWASNDAKLRGLQRRRAEEKEGVRNALLEEVIPSLSTEQELPAFMPSNPQAFFTPIESYQNPVIVEEPLVQAAMENPYSPEHLEREERAQGLRNLGLAMSIMRGGQEQSYSPLWSAVNMLSGNQMAKGGKIHIKPENRGKFTALKKRTGHSATWFKQNGTPAQKKMATFALNAKKWKHGLGGNLFSGEDTPTQQMQLGSPYWTNQDMYFDWQNSTINGETLPEVTVTPTNDASWLFSMGKYTNNSRKPLADSYTRKVVANYLSKFDAENAKDYNARITRLADAIFDTNGVIFQKNDVKEGKLKGRAHYNSNTGIAKIDSMDDIFSELAHPYQSWLGNNRKGDEISKEYDNDKDPRGGTRYAYPDTYEGETHGFFEPTLKEWIETGKIGRSLPILDKKLSKEKIVPKTREEVTDSAASWNRQAVDRRIIANSKQLPIIKRMKYSISKFPLLNKRKRALGGNIFDGTTQPTQQMNNGLNLYRRTNNLGETEYIYQETPDSEEILLTPTNKRFSDDPTNWDYKDASGRKYSPRMVSPSSSSTLETSEKIGPLEKYVAELNWRAKNDPASIALQGKYTMPTIASAWLAPLGETFAGTTIAGIPATTWANTAMAAGFAGHGLNHAVNEGINGWGDAAMTALEIVPLGRLARPMYNAGIDTAASGRRFILDVGDRYQGMKDAASYKDANGIKDARTIANTKWLESHEKPAGINRMGVNNDGSFGIYYPDNSESGHWYSPVIEKGGEMTLTTHLGGDFPGEYSKDLLPMSKSELAATIKYLRGVPEHTYFGEVGKTKNYAEQYFNENPSRIKAFRDAIHRKKRNK